MITDIFIRTYSRDIPWLGSCLASIRKYARGFREVIICIPGPQLSALNEVDTSGFRVVQCDSYANDYLGQQVTKVQAYMVSDAELIMFIDSDTLFTMITTPQDYLRHGNPIILKTPYVRIAPEADHWQRITQAILGGQISHEYMRCFPMVFRRDTLLNAANWCLATHNKSLCHYILSQPENEFSEFNFLGAFAERHEPSRYTFIDTDDEIPQLRVRQFWSWGGVTESVQAEIDAILGA